jgi:hypothetical protein
VTADYLPGTPAAVGRVDGGETPGVVVEWRIDGMRTAHDERVVVATKRDGERVEIDTHADRVRPLDGHEADVVKGVIEA